MHWFSDSIDVRKWMQEQDFSLRENQQSTSSVALIIIDLINDLEFEGAETIFDAAVAAAKNIALLKQRTYREKIPVIYANDNFGRWRSNFEEVVQHCLRSDARGRSLAEILRPTAEDYFVLKPKHSAFYGTPLEQLLSHLGCRQLVLCGISGNMCVQFTACDAYMRGFQLYVPQDCVASKTVDENRHSLEYMREVLGADTTRSGDLNLSTLRNNFQ